MSKRSPAEDAIEIQLNGQTRSAPAGLSLNAFLHWLELDPRKVAVERNREITPRSSYDAVQIEPGDQLEIVHFVGGG